MESSMAWLTAASSTLQDSKKSNNEWEAKKRDAEDALSKLDRNKRYQRQDECSQNDDSSQSGVSESDGEEKKEKQEAKLQERQLQQKQEKQKRHRRKKKNDNATSKMELLPSLPPPSKAPSSHVSNPPPLKDLKPPLNPPPLNPAPKKKKTRNNNLDTDANYKNEFPSHKSQTTIDGSFHAVQLWHLEDVIYFEATDPVKKETYKLKSRLVQSTVFKKTAIERDKFYETLIKRLAFKTMIDLEELAPAKKKNIPRYMQQTGKGGKKVMVLLKVDDKTKKEKQKNNAGLLPPFFRDKVCIDDIVLDISASTNASGDTTTINFYDSIYDASTDFSVPSHALPSFNAKEIEAATPATSLNNFSKHEKLSAKMDVRSVNVKYFINLVRLSRVDDEESVGNTALKLYVPQVVKDIVSLCEKKEKMAVKIQSIFRRNEAIVKTKSEMDRVKLVRKSAKDIQRIVRGRRLRRKWTRIRVRLRGARVIQCAVRCCLARRELRGRRVRRVAVTYLQCAARCFLARRKLKLCRLERKACTRIQKVERGRRARVFVRHMKREKEEKRREGAGLVIQTKIRQILAKERVKMVRAMEESALKIQGRHRVNMSKKIFADMMTSRAKGRSAVIIQRQVRRVLALNMFLKMAKKAADRKGWGAEILQSWWKGVIEKRMMVQREVSALRIQKRIRGVLGRWFAERFRDRNRRALQIQTVQRARKAKRIVNAKRTLLKNRQEAAAVVIQSRVGRSFLARREVALVRREKNEGAVKIQSAYKGSTCRKRCKLLRESNELVTQSSVKIQTAWRRYNGILFYWKLVIEHNAAIYIQTQARMLFARKYALKLQEAHFKGVFNAASLIEALCRGVIARKLCGEMRDMRERIEQMRKELRRAEAVVAIQRIYRGKVLNPRKVEARKRVVVEEEIKYEEKRRSAVAIQKRMRFCIAGMVVERRRVEVKSATMLQCLARGKRAKETRLKLIEILKMRTHSATVIANWWRVKKAELILGVMKLENVGAMTIQNGLYRVWKAKRVVEEEIGKKIVKEEKEKMEQERRKEELRREAIRLEEERKREKGAIILQKLARRRLAMKVIGVLRSLKLVKEKKAAETCQRAMRCVLARWKMGEMRLEKEKCVCLQRVVRGRLGRRRWDRLKEAQRAHDLLRSEAAVALQCFVRAAIARDTLRVNRHVWRLERDLKEEHGATIIQSLVRRRIVDIRVNNWKRAALIIQTASRRKDAYRYVRYWREYFDYQYWQAVLIQKVFRGFKGRKDMFFGIDALGCEGQKDPIFFSWVRHRKIDKIREAIEYYYDIDENMGEVEYFDDGSPNEFFGFQLGIVNATNNTLLHAAAIINSRAICKLLIKNGVSLNHQNDQGNTVAHMAFLAGWDELGYYLVDKIGVDDKIVNAEGRDCYEVATSGQVEMKRPDMYLGDGALGSNIQVDYDGGQGGFGMDYD